MKFLLKILDALRPTFTKGRLKAFHPAFDAMDSFLFSVPYKTDVSPHVRGPMSTKRYMSVVIVALMPCIAAAVYFFGLRILMMIAVTYAAGLTVELLFAMLRDEEINEGFFVTGLLYPLILPPALPLWMVAVGIAFGVLISKELFGGTGRNPFNPALVGRCLLLLGYPLAMSNTWVEPATGLLGNATRYVGDAVTGATPLAAARQSTPVYEPWQNLLFGNVSGCGGETSAVLIGLAAVLLIATGVANWRTIAATVGSFAILGGALNVLFPAKFGPLGFHLLAGGFLFGAVFMATDPITSPYSRIGKWIYGIIIGSVTVLIRNLTGYVEGVMFAILLGNIVAPVLDDLAMRAYFRRIRNER